MTPSDYQDGWVFEGGAVMQGFVQSWCHTMAGERELASGIADWTDMFDRPIAASGLEDRVPWYRRWLQAGREYWDPVSPRLAYERMDVAGYHVAGWFDLFCEGTIQNYVGLIQRAATARARRAQYLVIGPWTHLAPYARIAGEIDFGADATGGDVPGHQLNWLRDAVDDRPVESGVRAFDTGVRRWMCLDRWPPTTGERTLWLAADGSLADRVPDPGAVCFDYDPADPVPTLGGRGSGNPVAAGMYDQSSVESRGDVVVFSSEPLASAMTVAGSVSARVTFATTGRSADVVVRLCDVAPDGSSYNIVDSVRRETFEPGVHRAIDVHVGSCVHTFGAGHRVRVQATSSNFPRLDRNPSTGIPVVEAREPIPARQCVYTGSGQGSSVSLPVLPA